MNKTLKPEELEHLLATAKPFNPEPRPMTREQKLLRWAHAVAVWPYPLSMLHGVEYAPLSELDHCWGDNTIFDVARRDPVLFGEGCIGHTIGSGVRFFQLDHGELHWLACDCMGAIDNLTMASRIERVAKGDMPRHEHPTTLMTAHNYRVGDMVPITRLFTETPTT